MENWDKPTRDHRKQHHRENPSFSSTLLDAIYRSIDEGQQEQQQQTEEKQQDNKLIFYREAMRKQKHQKQQKDNNNNKREDGGEAFAAISDKPSSRRARKVEIWMEKKASEKVLTGRNSLMEFERRTRSNSINALSTYSSSTSSESSSVGGFSSSESESFLGVHRPKPIRTSLSEKPSSENHKTHPSHAQTQKPKHENNGLGKTKSKALRILYGDLKKSKQPISPGARLASFLNSLFNNAKKAKVSSSSPVAAAAAAAAAATVQQHEVSSVQGVSTCSSASSFSRSCLSKTPSSRTGGAKRSVRFCPVSVIVDEDCRPCGEKNLHEESMQKKKGGYGYGYGYGKSSSSDEEVRLHVLQESRRVEELARDLLKNYQKKNEKDFDMMHYDDDDDDDDDDGASCSSSDLFELDNLSAIGIERYREELPVYETTHFNTKRAIANGFIL